MEDKKELIDNEQVPIPTSAPPGYDSTTPPPQLYAYGGHNAQNQYQYQQHGVVQQPCFGNPSQVIIVRNPQAPPKDYMVMAILVTIFCCLPFGIVGVVKASSARTLYATGNYPEAERTSQSAGNWSKAGLVCGTVFFLVYATLLAIYFVVIVDYDDY